MTMSAPEICSEEIKSGVKGGSQMIMWQRRVRTFRLGGMEHVDYLDSGTLPNSPTGQPFMQAAIGDLDSVERMEMMTLIQNICHCHATATWAVDETETSPDNLEIMCGGADQEQILGLINREVLNRCKYSAR